MLASLIASLYPALDSFWMVCLHLEYHIQVELLHLRDDSTELEKLKEKASSGRFTINKIKFYTISKPKEHSAPKP